MSYEVLARKWRPTCFADVVGQETAVRALQNALAEGRLHHAYLFTGTRGVGKTTLARIMARALNCEQGIVSEPCGSCVSCREISEGRFPDLMEVDAASRTKVEDTRDLLENIQYAPVRGRFRVYLIDEVHMLSGHSFNALLKTLEEPPEHVKFLLATTDPRKLPATVLSRCLQFHLRRIPAPEIASHLQGMLEKEKIPAEEGALRLLARAADGSLRDAISLCDQAIAHGGGKLEEAQVGEMLGTVDQGRVFALLEALGEGDGVRLLGEVAEMSMLCPDYEGILAELLGVVHRVAVLQAVPDMTMEEERAEQLGDMAKRFTPEELQIFYQAGVVGRRDFSLAPDPRSALEMTLLRMLAFRPGADTAGADAEGGRRAQGGEKNGGKSADSAGDNDGKDKQERGEEQAAQAGQSVAKSASSVGDDDGKDPQDSTEERAARAGQSGAKSASSVGDDDGKDRQDSTEERAARAGQSGAKSTGGASDDGGKDMQDSAQRSTEERAAQERRAVMGRAEQGADDAPSPAAENGGLAPLNGDARGAVLFHPEEWNALVENLSLEGFSAQVARNCAVEKCEGEQVFLVLDEKSCDLFRHGEERCIAAMERALGECFAQAVRVSVRVGQPEAETLQSERVRQREEERAAAERKLRDDPNVQLLQKYFGVRLDPASITFLGSADRG